MIGAVVFSRLRRSSLVGSHYGSIWEKSISDKKQALLQRWESNLQDLSCQCLSGKDTGDISGYFTLPYVESKYGLAYGIHCAKIVKELVVSICVIVSSPQFGYLESYSSPLLDQLGEMNPERIQEGLVANYEGIKAAQQRHEEPRGSMSVHAKMCRVYRMLPVLMKTMLLGKRIIFCSDMVSDMSRAVLKCGAIFLDLIDAERLRAVPKDGVLWFMPLVPQALWNPFPEVMMAGVVKARDWKMEDWTGKGDIVIDMDKDELELVGCRDLLDTIAMSPREKEWWETEVSGWAKGNDAENIRRMASRKTLRWIDSLIYVVRRTRHIGDVPLFARKFLYVESAESFGSRFIVNLLALPDEDDVRNSSKGHKELEFVDHEFLQPPMGALETVRKGVWRLYKSLT